MSLSPGTNGDADHHIPITFHHSGPTPSQITRFISEMMNPSLHQSAWLMYPAPKKTGAEPVP